MLRESPEAAVIPEKVAQRMGKRMLPFVGIPLFGAMGSFVGFWYFATYRDQEFQPALVAAVSIGLLAMGLVVRFFFSQACRDILSWWLLNRSLIRRVTIFFLSRELPIPL